MNVAQLNLSAAAVPAASGVVTGIDTAGFGRRAAARILDTILHIGVAFVSAVFLALVIAIGGAVTGTPTDATLERLAAGGTGATLMAIFGSTLYMILCEGLFGASAGKYLLGMVVLSEDGRPCSYVQAVGRSFAFYFDALFFGLVGYSSMKDSPRDQRYGDKWSRTIVAMRSSAPPHPLRSPLRFVGVFVLAMFVDAVAISVGSLL